jgi:hypothetical protein
MAYENYLFVSWTSGTPITGARLAQMSTNIEQVKDVINNKATGVIKFTQVTSQSPNSTGYSDFYSNVNTATEHDIIYLRDDSGTGGSDNRVSIDANRYYKVTVNIPAITVLNAGAEDSKYTVNIYSGTGLGNSPTKIAFWEFTPPPYTYINTAGGTANISNAALKTATYPTKIAGGTFTVLRSTPSALVNQSFFATVYRTQGASANNAPLWRVEGNSAAPLQLYIEDAGGI